MSQEKADSDFSAIIASSVHDMKNSLCMLLGALDEIMTKCEPSHCPSSEGFNHVRYEGQRVNNSLIQLLSIYRINNGQYSLNLTENEVEECLEECFMESQGLLELKGIESELNCDDELLWYFDRNLIVGMLNSVVNNSYKYTKSIIKINTSIEDGYLIISVEDDGNGYPEAMLHSENTHETKIDYKTGSTGLGLYFASKIASMHESKGKRGFITTTNDGISGGGKFSIYIP
jgi:two-component system, OmpR family, sensor histidine kinase SenX3